MSRTSCSAGSGVSGCYRDNLMKNSSNYKVGLRDGVKRKGGKIAMDRTHGAVGGVTE